MWLKLLLLIGIMCPVNFVCGIPGGYGYTPPAAGGGGSYGNGGSNPSTGGNSGGTGSTGGTYPNTGGNPGGSGPNGGTDPNSGGSPGGTGTNGGTDPNAGGNPGGTGTNGGTDPNTGGNPGGTGTNGGTDPNAGGNPGGTGTNGGTDPNTGGNPAETDPNGGTPDADGETDGGTDDGTDEETDGDTDGEEPEAGGSTQLGASFEQNFFALGKAQPDKSIPKIDLAIVFDFARTLDPGGFLEARNFAEKILSYFSISPSSTRVGLVRYSAAGMVKLTFKKCTNRECVIKEIRTINYAKSTSLFEDALSELEPMFTKSNKNGRQIAKKVVLVITDGCSGNPNEPSEAINDLKNNLKAVVFVVKINKLKDTPHLKMIASTPTENYLYEMDQPLALRELAKGTGAVVKFTLCDKPGQVIYDECNKRCVCVDGKLKQCYRIRKEFVSMGEDERTLYLATYKTLTTKMPYKTRYDELTRQHSLLFRSDPDNGIHTKSQFLPWHRYYILELENLLRELDCTTTVPYWDWSLWAHDPWNTSHIWSSTPHGLGGTGGQGSCVPDGQFSQTQGWSTPDRQCLRRTMNPQANMPDAAYVQLTLNRANFESFELSLRTDLHDRVHVAIGGTMSTVSSAYAPEFFLHHCYIDKLWKDWQALKPENRDVFFPSVDGDMDGSSYARCEFIDLADQPGCVKVQYDEPNSNKAKKAKVFLSAMSDKALKEMPRKKIDPIPQEAFDLFKVSPDEQIQARKNEKENEGNVVSSSAGLPFDSEDEKLGFSIPPSLQDIDWNDEIDISVGLPDNFIPFVPYFQR